jgi:hypothetical protein
MEGIFLELGQRIAGMASEGGLEVSQLQELVVPNMERSTATPADQANDAVNLRFCFPSRQIGQQKMAVGF